MKEEFLKMKEMFIRNRWINFTPTKIEEFFNNNFQRIDESFAGMLDNVIRILDDKIGELRQLSKERM